MLRPPDTRGLARRAHHGAAHVGTGCASSLGLARREPPAPGRGADAGDCRVGPGRGARLSTSPFPRTALRTRRASHPGTGLSTRPVTKQNGCVAARLRSTRPGLPDRDAGIHRRLLPCRHAAAASLCPFALCTPLACSDYYGHSATTRHHQPTTRLPAAPRREGRRRVASHVRHHPVDEVAAQLSSGSLARGTTQPFPLASPTGHYLPAAESPAATAAGVHC